jgi:hypothetical protein
MSANEKAFGLPAGHSLRLVRTAPRGDERIASPDLLLSGSRCLT